MPKSRLEAHKLSGEILFDSSHKSSLFLSIYSISLYNAKDNAIGRKESAEEAFGIGITLYAVQDWEI